MKGFALFTLSAAVAMAAAGSVKPTVSTPKLKVWHNVVYGSRTDMPDEGEGFRGRNGDWQAAGLPWRMCRHCSAQKLDIYAPGGYDGAEADVLVYIHGGMWSHCFDKEAIPSAFRDAILSRDAILVSPGYILQVDNTMNMAEGRRDEATFVNMLKDIDLAVSFLAKHLPAFGINPRRFILAGESAGAQLALLYAYDQTNPKPLGLGLDHALRFSRVVDIVGPVDFLQFDDGEPTESLKPDDKRIGIRVLFKRLCGLPDDSSDTKLREELDRYSPVRLVSASSPETVMAYGKAFFFMSTDGIIPVAQMRTLERELDRYGVKHSRKVFSGSHHGKVSTDGASWIATEALR